MRHEFAAHITEEKTFVFDDKAQWRAFSSTQKPGQYIVSLRRQGPPRRLNQNALYWKRIDVLCSQSEIDLTESGLHEYLMIKCGYAVTKVFRGQVIYDRESSTSLTIDEFSRLMAEQDELARYCNEGREVYEYITLPGAE